MWRALRSDHTNELVQIGTGSFKIGRNQLKYSADFNFGRLTW